MDLSGRVRDHIGMLTLKIFELEIENEALTQRLQVVDREKVTLEEEMAKKIAAEQVKKPKK